MPARRISSAQTFVIKFLCPALWIGGFAFVTLLLFRQPDGAADPAMKWVFLLVTLVGTAFLFHFCVRLKRVVMDDTSLRVSNYREEIQVPLQDIERVTELRWVNIHPVTIHLVRPTDFGDRIVFMPTFRIFSWAAHPVVAELRSAAARARGRST
jgi:hypothetical protein